MLQSGKCQLIVVAYDISSNKRRQKVAKLLEGFGVRVNFSVFECFLTIEKIRELKKSLALLINKNTDLILFYNLCKSCVNKRSQMGGSQQTDTLVKVL